MDYLAIVSDRTRIVIDKVVDEDYKISYSETFSSLTESEFSEYMEDTASFVQDNFKNANITSDVLISLDAKDRTYNVEFFCKHEHIDLILRMFSMQFRFVEYIKDSDKIDTMMSMDEIIDISKKLLGKDNLDT